MYWVGDSPGASCTGLVTDKGVSCTGSVTVSRVAYVVSLLFHSWRH